MSCAKRRSSEDEYLSHSWCTREKLKVQLHLRMFCATIFAREKEHCIRAFVLRLNTTTLSVVNEKLRKHSCNPLSTVGSHNFFTCKRTYKVQSDIVKSIISQVYFETNENCIQSEFYVPAVPTSQYR